MGLSSSPSAMPIGSFQIPMRGNEMLRYTRSPTVAATVQVSNPHEG